MSENPRFDGEITEETSRDGNDFAMPRPLSSDEISHAVPSEQRGDSAYEASAPSDVLEAPFTASHPELMENHAHSALEGQSPEGKGAQEIGGPPPAFFSNGYLPAEPPQFSFEVAPVRRPPMRTPTFVDALLFSLMLLAGVLVGSGLLGAALYFHWLDRWLGVHGFEAAAKSTPVALGTELLMYVVALALAVPVFRMIWSRSFFSGIHWHGVTALRFRYVLFGVAVGCNLLAIVGNWVLPFPEHAPIDKLFGTRTDAWMLACFGIAIAPFFEEMIFRGFMLPALATAWDWFGERLHHTQPRPLDAAGNPVWSVGAMVFAALLVSAPFAAMHAPQVGNAWGPVILLYCISLILCAVRLVTKSLAASTLVHASYNFLLFAVMFAETGGFRHLDKL